MNKSTKTLCTLIPYEACPHCRNSQFIVIESTMDVFLTDNRGGILQHNEMKHTCVGKCITCNHEYPMLSTSYGFIPVTEFAQKFIDPDQMELEYIKENPRPVYISNPMEKKENINDRCIR